MYEVGQTIRMSVETEIVAAVDVLIAGGGTAGVVAAIAAARRGASVMLVERYGSLGGMMTSGNAGLTMYTKFSGNLLENTKDHKTLATNPAELQIAGGITRELTNRILAEGAGIGNSGTFGRYVFTSAEDFKRIIFQMLKEAGVKLRLHSWVVDVIQENGELKALVLESKSGRQAIVARQFIDATGDGDVAARAGVPYYCGVTPEDLCAKETKIGVMQSMGVMFKVGNVDLQATFDWLAENPDRFEMQAFARFTLAEARERFAKGEMGTLEIRMDGSPSSIQVYNLPSAGVVTLCCPSVQGNGCNVEDLTRAEVIMADMVGRWLVNIKKAIPGFQNAFLLDCPEIGVRETRHILGDYVMNIEDMYHQKKFEDCIGFGSHPIDTHPRPEWLKDPETAYPPHWYFQIPFRSLTTRGKTNLLTAGRCISATHEAAGSIRVTVECMITGEAAGTAAALCAKANIPLRELDYVKLRATLRESGTLC
ncbi:MAG: FAD-dependent oxidoreductase [Kiritimatiellaeota bacterium]|nr:FAD-dependent oxidoreductase [Kiritimatiellota bacterium]